MRSPKPILFREYFCTMPLPNPQFDFSRSNKARDIQHNPKVTYHFKYWTDFLRVGAPVL